MSLNNQQIRSYEPLGNRLYTWGVAAGAVNFDFVVPVATDLVSFGCGNCINNVPNDPLLPAWLTNISITINGSFEVVRDFTRAEYIQAVQNLESKEVDVISNGNMLFKSFKPALPAGTRIQINLGVNTLALSYNAAANATAIFQANTYDAQANAPTGNELTFYQRIPQFPQPVGVVAAQAIQQDLGVEVKTMKYVAILERANLVLQDLFTGDIELIANGNTIARVNAPTAKKHYSLITDGQAIPVGWSLLKLPGGGWNASQATTLHLRITPHTTGATGNYVGFQIIKKPFK